MTLSDEEKSNLVKYKIDRAEETIEEARILIDNNKLFSAVNRIYYANFYILSALALKHGFSTSKHKQLIGWFNKTFVKPGIAEGKFSSILLRSFENRSEGDYGDFVKFNKEEVEVMFNEMKEFVREIGKLINS